MSSLAQTNERRWATEARSLSVRMNANISGATAARQESVSKVFFFQLGSLLVWEEEDEERARVCR